MSQFHNNLKRRLIDLILFSKYKNSFLVYDFGSFFVGRFLSIKMNDKSMIKWFSLQISLRGFLKNTGIYNLTPSTAYPIKNPFEE